MKLRLCLLTVMLLYGLPGRCEIHDIMKSADIDALFAKTETSTDVQVKSNYIISLRVQSGPGAWVTHLDEDEIWLVRRGAAKLSLGTVTLGAGVRRSDDDKYEVGTGDVVNIPRTMAYQLMPSARFEYIVIQIFPTERHTPPARADKPMPHVVKNATIEETFAKNTTNQPLHTLGAASMNHVIYMGAPGPYEVHINCDDLYFVRMGNATAQVDGHVLNPTEVTPGEVRGTGAFGFREHKVDVGDILVIPRNTMHHMDPGAEKLGYLLLKVYQ